MLYHYKLYSILNIQKYSYFHDEKISSCIMYEELKN